MNDMTARRIAYACFVLAALVALSSSLFSSTTPPAAGSVVLLANPGSISELAEDTGALAYLKRTDVYGVIVKPSTLGGAQSARDVAVASGAEILRLFRLEAIVNIWMWEQVKDKPIKPDAVYIFTNQLIVYRSLMTALTERFGADKVRAYNDKEHDFGGEVPGNYIIETKLTKEQLLSIVTGLDKTYRDTLKQAGLTPIFEVSSADDVEELPRTASAVFVASDEAARLLHASRSVGEVYLANGVRNPGWFNAVTAYESIDEMGLASGAALLVHPSEAAQAITELKRRGIAAGHEERRAPQSATFSDILEPLSSLIAKALLLIAFLVALAESLDALGIVRGKIWFLALSGIALAAAFVLERGGIAGLAAVGAFWAAVHKLMRRRDAPNAEESALRGVALALLLMVAGHDPSFNARMFSLGAVTVAFAALTMIYDGVERKSNPLLYGIAFLATLFPRDPWLAVLFIASFPALLFLRRDAEKTALLMLSFAAAVAAALNYEFGIVGRFSAAALFGVGFWLAGSNPSILRTEQNE